MLSIVFDVSIVLNVPIVNLHVYFLNHTLGYTVQKHADVVLMENLIVTEKKYDK